MKFLFHRNVKFHNNLQLSLRPNLQVYLDFFQQVVRMYNLGIFFRKFAKKVLLSHCLEVVGAGRHPLGADHCAGTPISLPDNPPPTPPPNPTCLK